MKFLSINNFVNETLKLAPNTKQINIVFSVKEAIEDKFNKLSVTPLLIILTGETKEVCDYNKILEKYGEEIKLTLPKTVKSKNGYANLQISTESTYSEKFESYYYKRQYGDLTNKVITKAIESKEQKEKHESVEVLDI